MKRVSFTKLVKFHENASMGAVGAGAIASTAMPLGQKKRKKKSPVRRRTKSNLEEATTTPYLFHATFTEKVPSIVKQGLRQYLELLTGSRLEQENDTMKMPVFSLLSIRKTPSSGPSK